MRENERIVVLVDDDSVLASSMQRSLALRAVRLRWASSMAMAMASFSTGQREDVAIVFLSLDLPDGDGEALLPLARECFVNTPIVAVAQNLRPARAVALLRAGVPCISKPIAGEDLAPLLDGPPDGSRCEVTVQQALSPLALYCAHRKLSPRQRSILQLYFAGENDKEIATKLGCQTATVHEQWRRIARKAQGRQKSDAIADFHRFLANEVGVASSAAGARAG